MDATDNFTQMLQRTVGQLSDFGATDGLFHQQRKGVNLPSGAILEETIALCRAVLFPGYYGKSTFNKATLEYHIGTAVERLYDLLSGQVEAGLCFECKEPGGCQECHCRERAQQITCTLIERLPEVRRLLATDVRAAYEGDPAAQSYGEVISCYPAFKALTCYRIAHELHSLGVPLVPRIITETAHSETGIDIHPGARIGHHFAIDHGTGVVVGATCVIGNHVKLYQGVTLGAKSFPLDEEGKPIKNIPRHPVIGDNVIIYSNATILGRVSIGEGAVVGANVWLTRDVAAGERVAKE